MKIKGKKIAAAFCCLMLSACGSEAINRSLYASAMGFSRIDGMYTVTVCGDTIDDDGKVLTLTASGRGADPVSAVKNAGENCGHEIFYGHCGAMAVDIGAVSDKEFYHAFTDSVISPACAVYYSEDPAEDISAISGGGFSEKLFHAAAECIGEEPIILPCAADTEKAAVTYNGAEIFGYDDSYGLMLLCGKEYPRTLTEKDSGGRYTAVTIEPKISRRVKQSGGKTLFELTIKTGTEITDKKVLAAVHEYITGICGSAFEKTVLSGIDAPGIGRLSGKTINTRGTPELVIILE